jgi:hypothetical protein
MTMVDFKIISTFIGLIGSITLLISIWITHIHHDYGGCSAFVYPAQVLPDYLFLMGLVFLLVGSIVYFYDDLRSWFIGRG